MALPENAKPIVLDGNAARQAKRYGATFEVYRFDSAGVWLGRDFYRADGSLALQSMRASGNPQPG